MGGAAFGLSVVNNGLMQGTANYTAMVFESEISGTGSIDVGLDEVTLNAGVSSGQTLQFVFDTRETDPPTLTINDVQEFAGLISGFDQNGATVDQLVVNTATWAFQDFVPNSGGTGGALMFSSGGAETAVNLVGAYAASGFHAAVAGTQTTITYSSPAG